MQTKKVSRIFLAGLFLIIAFSCMAMAQQKSKNDILFDAMSPYEDLTEYALADNVAKVKENIQSLDVSEARLINVLSERAIRHLNINIEKMITAEKSSDYAGIALYAVNSYKTIVDELDVAELTTPVEVAILDFVGFKIHALLKQKNVDWRSIGEVVLEGSSRWNKIKENVSNKALQDTMNTTIDGLQTAVKSKNIEMLKFAAQVVLDLVDLLEGYFEDKK